MEIKVNVNGTERAADVEPRELLVHVIREEFELTGTHVGCDTTSCGACTVLLDGVPIKSCTMFGVQADGRSITTVEGLIGAAGLHPIQAAFKEEHGLQCGFCTPGMMLIGAALIEQNPAPSDDDVRWAISGHICRCTGYMNIVKAIQAAAATKSGLSTTGRQLADSPSVEGAEDMASETEEIRGVGHSVKRVEDDRFIRGAGNYIDDIHLPGMLHMAILRSPYAHATLNGIDASKAQALPGVIAVVTGELMAQHNLAWMPTLSGDTQAVLATDKVRFQGQEVAAVIATDQYIAIDALELIDVDYDPLDPVTTPQQALEDGAPLIRTDKEGQENNHVYPWETGNKEATDLAFSQADVVVSLDTFYPRIHPAPLETCGCIADISPATGQVDDLHDVAGAARDPHGVRARHRAPRGEDPHHLPRHRRRVRQQGAGVPRLRRGHGRVAAARPPREVDRVPLGEPDLDRVRARLPHARRARAEERRHHARPARIAAGRRGRVLRRRAAVQVQGGPVPHRERLVRPARDRTSRPTARTRTRRPAASRTGARSA